MQDFFDMGPTRVGVKPPSGYKPSVMRKMKAGAVCLALAPIVVSGCASPARHSGDRTPTSATSLVYPPAAQIPDGRAADVPQTSTFERGADRLRPGARCRVHLRRDAAGLAGQAPVSIVGASMLSEKASVVGTIDRIDPDAVILRGDGSTYWIPRGVILAVEFPDERRP